MLDFLKTSGLESALATIVGDDASTALRLHISFAPSAAELQEVYWETLAWWIERTHPLERDTYFARFIPDRAEPSRRLARPLRIQMIVASDHFFNLKEQLTQVLGGLHELVQQGAVEISLVDRSENLATAADRDWAAAHGAKWAEVGPEGSMKGRLEPSDVCHLYLPTNSTPTKFYGGQALDVDRLLVPAIRTKVGLLVVHMMGSRPDLQKVNEGQLPALMLLDQAEQGKHGEPQFHLRWDRFYSTLLRTGAVDEATAALHPVAESIGSSYPELLPILWTTAPDGRIFEPLGTLADEGQDQAAQSTVSSVIAQQPIDAVSNTTLPQPSGGETPSTASPQPVGTANAPTIATPPPPGNAATTAIPQPSGAEPAATDAGPGRGPGNANQAPNSNAGQGAAPPPAPINVVVNQVQGGGPTADQLSIKVGPKTVELRVGTDPKLYKSPNLLDMNELTANEADRREYGRLLFAGVVHSTPSAGAGKSRTTRAGFDAAVNASPKGLRVALDIDANDPGLNSLAWEYLVPPDDPTPLAVVERSPFFRSVTASSRSLPVEGDRLKVLVAICNPPGLGQADSPNKLLRELAPLNVEVESAIAVAALSRLASAGLAEFRVLGTGNEPVTLPKLAEALQDGYHVLHLVCHGLFLTATNEDNFRLVIERVNSANPLLPAAEFEQLVQAAGNLGLVVLMACQGAVTSVGDALKGLGPKLVQAGLPAVVAMQEQVPVPTAQRFTQHFYDDLARTGRIDMAMAATRLAIFQEEGSELGTWGIPVLFLGGDSGQLFSVDKVRAAALPAITPDIRSLNQLAGGIDPTLDLLTPALEARARQLGIASLAGTLRQALGSVVGGNAAPAPPLATPQDRAGLRTKLKTDAKLTPAGLIEYVGTHSKLSLEPGAYDQIASALNTGKHVVLIGPPGTGKSSLAKDICGYAKDQGLSTETAFTTATADWTTFDTVGGFVPTQDQTLQFRPGICLQAIGDGRWLAIDELNRAEIDKAIGELFTVLSGQRVDLPYRVGDKFVRIMPAEEREDGNWLPDTAETFFDYVVPPTWRIIGTMNVYDKSALFNMSLAFMRRFAFVDLDLPPDYKALRKTWIEKFLPKASSEDKPDVLAAQALRDALGDRLDALMDLESALMNRRALGPAIARDIIRYIGDRLGQDPAAVVADPLLDKRLAPRMVEAFLLYAAPQLDGLDREGILPIYAELKARLAAEAVPNTERAVLKRVETLYPYIARAEWDEVVRAGAEDVV